MQLSNLKLQLIVKIEEKLLVIYIAKNSSRCYLKRKMEAWVRTQKKMEMGFFYLIQNEIRRGQSFVDGGLRLAAQESNYQNWRYIPFIFYLTFSVSPSKTNSRLIRPKKIKIDPSKQPRNGIKWARITKGTLCWCVRFSPAHYVYKLSLVGL